VRARQKIMVGRMFMGTTPLVDGSNVLYGRTESAKIDEFDDSGIETIGNNVPCIKVALVTPQL
jgi:hypothetical protein